MIQIKNEVLTGFAGVRERLDTLDYSGTVNPVDGVEYPGISTAITARVRRDAVKGIADLLGRQPRINTMFLRLSLEGVMVPHQAHNDSLMGAYSAMLYLNRPAHCNGGTSFLQHKYGLPNVLCSADDTAIWQRDTNRPAQWEVIEMCPMKSNRLCVFPSELWHRAEPIGGFGHNPANGRLVLTAFFE